MRFGKTKEEIRMEVFCKAIPERVYAWIPRKTDEGPIIWLEYLWRWAAIFEGSNMRVNYWNYNLTEEEAVIKSKNRLTYGVYQEAVQYKNKRDDIVAKQAAQKVLEKSTKQTGVPLNF